MGYNDQYDDKALENFDMDGSGGFDDEAASNFGGKKRSLRPASFDLTFTNVTNEAITIELFNYLKSFTHTRRLDIITSATVLNHPLNSFEGLALNRAGCVGFNEAGDLQLTGAAAAVAVTVKCGQFPYKGVFESSALRSFRIKAVRMTTTTDGQIDNPITHFVQTFLGAKAENQISPRTSFKPDQFQSKIIDIPMDFLIDRERGLTYTINANETVKWNVVIERWETE